MYSKSLCQWVNIVLFLVSCKKCNFLHLKLVNDGKMFKTIHFVIVSISQYLELTKKGLSSRQNSVRYQGLHQVNFWVKTPLQQFQVFLFGWGIRCPFNCFRFFLSFEELGSATNSYNSRVLLMLKGIVLTTSVFISIFWKFTF